MDRYQHAIEAVHSHRDTPEHRLWLAVLGTFVEDARNIRGSNREQKAEALLAELQSEWVREICDMCRADYDRLVVLVKDILGVI